MAIKTLDAKTVRTLSSTQTLNDASSLVKELVENAIDAKATSILVEVSANALDKIQVRDNGTGIPPLDRPMLCKRHCTSKISGLDDLKHLGGSSLGFRGEALASAAAISGGLTITTRTNSEPTAVEIRFSSAAIALGEKRVSHPVGTTVTVFEFLKQIPVRRQAAAKERAASLQIASIRRLLQAYAFTRSATRFSLKILQAKTEKDDWLYSPYKTTSTKQSLVPMQDALAQIFSRKVANQCMPSNVFFDSSNGEPLLQSDMNDSIHVEAYSFLGILLKVDAKLELPTAGSHHFISVDERPISGVHGLGKQIVSVFRKCSKQARKRLALRSSGDSLLVLNITCPRGSYDVNIEPTKDDVLFYDSERILQCARKYFHSVYGELDGDAVADTEQNDAASFDILLARREPHKSPVGDHEADSRTPNAKIVRTMDYDSEDEGQSLSNTADAIKRDESSSARNESVNPWMTAKLNAAMRRNDTNHGHGLKAPFRNPLLTPAKQPWDDGANPVTASSPPLQIADSRGTQLPTPASAPAPRSLLLQPVENHEPSHRSNQMQVALNDDSVRKVYANRKNPTEGFTRPMTGASSCNKAFRHPKLPGRPLMSPPLARTNNAVQDTERQSTLSSFAIPDHDRTDRLGGRTIQNMDPRLLDLESDHDQWSPFSPEDVPELSFNHSSFESTHPDFDEVMDYESRKSEAMKQYKKRERQLKLSAQEQSTSYGIDSWLSERKMQIEKNSPHRNRFNRAKAALQLEIIAGIPADRDQRDAASEDADPRMTLIKEQEAEASKHQIMNDDAQDGQHHAVNNAPCRSRRTRTSQLPLETSREVHAVIDLLLQLDTSEEMVAREMRRAIVTDVYIQTGKTVEKFSGCADQELEKWRQMAQALMLRRRDQTVSHG